MSEKADHQHIARRLVQDLGALAQGSMVSWNLSVTEGASAYRHAYHAGSTLDAGISLRIHKSSRVTCIADNFRWIDTVRPHEQAVIP